MVLVAAKYKTSDTEVDINNRMLTEFNLLTSTEGVSDALYYDLDGLMIKTIKICHLDVVYWYNCIGKRGKPRLYHFKWQKSLSLQINKKPCLLFLFK